ncbi:enhancer of mRNA decapping 4 [Podila epicladia]|nr:enhancer of mRNA decapping 4 [Podila epicladia]
MLQGQGSQAQNQGSQNQNQGQSQSQGMHQQHPQQQQQPPMGDMHQRPFFHSMGPPPHPIGQMGPMGPMGQMMPPGFGFANQGIDQHQMYLQMMHHSQRGSPLGHTQQAPHAQPQGRPQPQSNARASLLQSLNQPAVVSPTASSAATFNSQSSHSPVAAQTQATQAELQASTDSLKMALFGAPKQEPTAAQKQTEDLKLALFGGPRTEFSQPQPSPKMEETNLLAMLQKSSNTSSPAVSSSFHEPAQEQAEPTTVDSFRSMDSTKSPPPKESPVQPSTSRFTYVNPFHSFTSASHSPVQPTSSSPPVSRTLPAPAPSVPAPVQEPVSSAPSSKRSSVVAPFQRRETPTHTEPAPVRTHERDQKRYQVDQLLPPHSAWNHRVQKLAKGSSSVPDGVYLSHPGSAITVYDTGLDNSDAIFSEDLETIPITLIPTDVEYNHGKLVAVSKGYISYVAKGGKIRVIQQLHGHRTLLRGHTDQVIDMGFSATEALDILGLQLLASVGKDSRVIIWNLSGSESDSTDISHSKYMELVGVSQSDQPRYGRIAWNPAQPSVLALVNDDHSVLVVDVQKLMESSESPVISEAKLLQHAVVIEAHEQTINDIAYSADGSVIITASEDGTVKFWEVDSTKATLLHTFVPHGGLGVTNAIFVDQSENITARCVVTACRRGTELSLFQIDHSELLDQFVFKEPPSSSRRTSLGKGGSRLHDMRMFNFVGYDHETSSLVLANSVRLSLFGLKISVSALESVAVASGVTQAEYIKSTTESDYLQCKAKFDFMIEYPMPQPVVSFVVLPDLSLEHNGFSVYCIQAKAVQQYIIKGLEPHDKHKCLTFASTASAPKQTETKTKPSSRTTTPKASNSPSSKVNDNTDSTFKTQKPLELATAPASTVPEAQDKEPLRLHGPVINGAIAKLKEKKRNSANASTEGPVPDVQDKRESPKLTTSGRATRKSSQDLSSAAQEIKKPQASSPSETKAAGDSTRSARTLRRQDATSEGLPPVSDQSSTLLPSGTISVSVSEFQSLLQSMEDKISSRFEKKLTAELEQHYRRVEEDQISRQEAVLTMVSQSLAKNTEQLLVQTVHKEIQNSVVPSLNKIVGAAVERQLSRAISDAAVKALPSAIDTAVSENVERVMGSQSFVKELTTQVASSIRPSIEESFRESFTKTLIPSYQKATQAMFQQIHAAFQSGIEDLTSANQKDHEAVESLTQSVKKLSSNVEAIQASVAQVVQAQSDHSFPGSVQRPDPRRNVSGLQRALQGDENVAHSGYGSRRTSQQQSPVETKQMATINQLIAYSDFEEAFTQALSTNDPNIVFHICSKVSPRAVFQQTPTSSGTLSQPVLLALTHHLANEQLGQNLGTKLTWLQEVLMRLNPKDPMLSDHMSRILPTVHRRLSDTYKELITGTEPSPHLHTIQRLIAFVESMQL